MPLVHFDCPAIFACAVNLCFEVRRNLYRLAAVDEVEECLRGKPDDEALEETLIRLLQAMIPQQSTIDRELLRLGLFDGGDISDPKTCERMEAWSRLMADCECCDRGPEARGALLDLMLSLQGIRAAEGDGWSAWLAKLQVATVGLWRQLPESEQADQREMYNRLAAAYPTILRPIEDKPVESQELESQVGLTVDGEDVSILRALVNKSPLLLTQDTLEADSRVSRRTISARMTDLLQAGLIVQPKGPRSGTTITPKGKSLLQQIDRAQAAR